MDISPTIEPNSEQLNADDLISGPRTVTITGVEAGNKEQPVFVHLAEFPGRTYRPGKSMRRVFIAAWGKEASAYVGRQLTLYCDPTVRFGKDAVGGIRISAMSHIPETLTVALTVTRGKRAPFTVQPLAAADPGERVAKAEAALRAATDRETFDKTWDRVVAGGLSGVAPLPAVYAELDAKHPRSTVDAWETKEVKP